MSTLQTRLRQTDVSYQQLKFPSSPSSPGSRSGPPDHPTTADGGLVVQGNPGSELWRPTCNLWILDWRLRSDALRTDRLGGNSWHWQRLSSQTRLRHVAPEVGTREGKRKFTSLTWLFNTLLFGRSWDRAELQLTAFRNFLPYLLTYLTSCLSEGGLWPMKCRSTGHA